MATLVGSLLCSAAFPAFATTTDDGAPPFPKLRLTQALGALPGPVTLAPEAQAAVTPLSLARTLGNAASIGASNAGPSDAPSAAPLQAPRNAPRPDAPVPSRAPAAPPPRANIQLAAATTDDPGTTRDDGSGIKASVIGDGEFLPADEEDLPLPLPAQPAARPADAVERRASRGWGIAPIRWGGSVGAGLRQFAQDDGPATREQTYTLNLRASSYIIQPYIALVSGDVALNTIRASSGSDGSARSNNLTGSSITGSGAVNIFPQSRFPSSLSLSVSDSRNDSAFFTSNTRSTRFAARQDYRPEVGNWRLSGSYDRSQLDGDFGSDTIDRISGNFSTNWDRHQFNANSALSSHRDEERTTNDFFAFATHGYRYSDALNLDTSASHTRQRAELGASGADQTANVSSTQLYTVGTWAPLDSKWRSSGNLRYFETRTQFSEQASSENRNLAGGLSFSYLANRNLSVSGGLNASTSSTGDVVTSQTLSASYTGDPRQFGRYDYNWQGSASAANTTTDAGSSRSLGAGIGHGLRRAWNLGETTFLTASIDQSFGTSRSTGLSAGSTGSITHSANVSIQASATDRLTGFMSAGLSDNRTTGDNPGSFQLFNVQVSGNWRISNYSEMNSNLTWQIARQNTEIRSDDPTSPDTDSRTQNSSLSGGLSYRHARALGVRNLRYTLDFRANTSRFNSRESGDLDAQREPEQLTMDLDQRLLYRIGRVNTELQYRLAETQQGRNSLIFFRVTRDFGAF